MTSVLGLNDDEAVQIPNGETQWELVPFDFHKPYRDLLARIRDIVSTGDSGRAALVHPLEEYYLCAVFPEEGPRLVGKVRVLQALFRADEQDGL